MRLYDPTSSGPERNLSRAAALSGLEGKTIGILENGKLNAFAVDTLAPEPPAKDHPFFTMSDKAAERFIITPHVAGTTAEAFTRMLQWVIADFQEVLEGKVPGRVCNGVNQLR